MPERFPPPALDDTQPTPLLSDTQRIRPVRRKHPRRWPGVLLGLLLVAILAGAIIALLPALAPPPPTITFIQDGTPASIVWPHGGGTVGAFLQARGVLLYPDDALLPAESTPLTDGLTITLERAQPMLLTVNGEMRVLRQRLGAGRSAADVLNAAGVRLQPGDDVQVDGQTTQANALAENAAFGQIGVVQRRAFTLVEQIGGGTSERALAAAALTVGEALFQAGVPLTLADTVTPELDTPLTDGLAITVRRPVEITVEADGEPRRVEVAGETVGDALSAAGIVLVGMDYAVPDEAAPLRPGERVRVFRVREALERELTPLPYETLYQADPEAELDTTRGLQAGREGVQQTTTRVRYENGVAIARTVEATTTLREPQNAIIGFGTQVVLRTVQTPDGPREYWRTYRVYATSYHPAALGGDDVTATGRRLRRGIVGADPDLLPYGTEIFVEGYGTGIIADTGAPRETTRWIDLGYSDDDFINWHRYVTVYLLTPVPSEIDYNPPG